MADIQNFDQVKQIVDKVRCLFAENKRLEDVINLSASIHLSEIRENIVIDSIDISGWFGNKIRITNDSIVYTYYFEGKRKREVLLKYKDWDELLNITN